MDDMFGGDDDDEVSDSTYSVVLKRFSLSKDDLFPLFWVVIFEKGKMIGRFVLTSTIHLPTSTVCSSSNFDNINNNIMTYDNSDSRSIKYDNVNP